MEVGQETTAEPSPQPHFAMEFAGDLRTEGRTDQRSRVSLGVLGQGGWVQVPYLERHRVRLSQHQKDMKKEVKSTQGTSYTSPRGRLAIPTL